MYNNKTPMYKFKQEGKRSTQTEEGRQWGKESREKTDRLIFSFKQWDATKTT